MKDFREEWEERIVKAADYIENGDPLKDVLDDCELADMIVNLKEALEEM